MLNRLLPPIVVKEVRALLPVWLGCLAALPCLAAVDAGTAFDGGAARAVGMFIYGGASVALGALSIGHEYSHRTISLWLTQPAPRARLYFVKQAVLAALLVILAMVAWTTVFYASRVTAMVVVLAVLCGLGLAPWLTMLCRNPLAGALFPIPIAGWTWLLVDAFVAAPLKITVFSRVLAALCTVAAALGWRAFMRLETKDGRGQQVHMQWSSPDAATPAARSAHPVWSLVKKELGLQQMIFVVVAIYVVGSFRVLSHVTEIIADVHGAMTILYSGVMALLIGSLSSAEERQHGTLESQLLLPVASSRQWIVKVGVAVGLSLLLAVGLPALLVVSRGRAMRINDWYVSGVLILTVTSVYLSSLCNSGLLALLLSVLATPFVMFIGAQSILGRPHLTALQALLLGGMLMLVLWFGLENHRSSDRAVSRIARQAFVMAGCLALAGVVLATLHL